MKYTQRKALSFALSFKNGNSKLNNLKRMKAR